MPRFTERVQECIINVYNFFSTEKLQGAPIELNNVTARVAQALRIDPSSVTRVKSRGMTTDESYNQNRSKKISSSRKKIDDSIFTNSLREVVYKMYAERTHVTLKTICARVNEEFGGDYNFSRSFVYKRLKKIGFRWRRSDNRRILMEQPHILMHRTRFLRSYIENLQSKNPLTPVFLDETWIFANGAFRKSWQDGTLATCSRKKSEGSRYIVVDAGGKEGFVPNASLVFRSNIKSGDYHDNMNYQNFEKWFKEKLLPNLKQKSLIILDNASYHSRLQTAIPNKSWTKGSLIAWLKDHGLEYPEAAMKDEIWKIVSLHRDTTKVHHLDEYVKQFGHKILRLPPYHCHFNPIEMVWSECKRRYDTMILNTALVREEAVLTTWRNVLKDVSTEHWGKYVRHVEKDILSAWEKQRIIDSQDIMPVIINLSEDSPSSDYESDVSDTSSYVDCSV